jgi:anti-anti-sigma factor
LALRGELDNTHAAWLARALSAAAASGARIIVDLEGLAFIDCSAVDILVSASEQTRQAGVTCGSPPHSSWCSAFFPSPI